MKCDASLCTKNNIELLKESANILDAFCLLNINSFPYTTDTSLVLNITSSDILSLIYTIIDAKFTIKNSSIRNSMITNANSCHLNFEILYESKIRKDSTYAINISNIYSYSYIVCYEDLNNYEFELE